MGYDYVHALESHLGNPEFTVLITKNNTQYIQPQNLKKIEALMGDRLIISANSKKDISSLTDTGKFLCVLTLGWRKLIDVDNFSTIPFLVNVHPALLPEYKGYHPVPYVLINNEKIHGITAHFITNEMDAGDIVLRKEIVISTFSTLPSLQSRVNEEMPSFLNELLDLINSGNISGFENDDEKTIVRAPRRKPEDSEVLLSDTVEQMFGKVKASDSDRFPAYFVIEGEKVYVRLSREPGTAKQTIHDI